MTAGEISRERVLVKQLIHLLELEEHLSHRDAILKLLLEVAERQSGNEKLVQFGAIQTSKRLVNSENAETSSIAKRLLQMLRDGARGRQTPTVAGSIHQTVSVATTSPNRAALPARLYEEPQHRGWRAPPYLPDAVATFESVHLSLLDKETLNSFASLVSGVNIDPSEEKLFDIICLDFGAQVFLQRSQLFKILLNGLEPSHHYRFVQNLNYLKLLVKGWPAVFRAFVDMPSSSGYSTPANNMPNVSVESIQPFAAPDGTSSESPISIPFAANEIFVRLISILRPNEFAKPILEIIEMSIPYLKIHIETAVVQTYGEANPSDGKEISMFYFHQILSAAKHFSKRNCEWQLAIVFKQQLILIAFTILQIVSDIVESPHEVVMNVIVMIATELEPADTDALTSLASTVVSLKNEASFEFLELMQSLLKKTPSSDIIVKTFMRHMRSDDPHQVAYAGCIMRFLFACGIADMTEFTRSLASSATLYFAQHSSPDGILAHSLELQGLSFLEASLAHSVSEQINTAFHAKGIKDGVMLYNLRGLFHRDEEVRTISFEVIRNLLPVSSKNMFIFNSSVLAFAANEYHTRPDTFKQKTSIAELVNELSRAVSNDHWRSGLFDDLARTLSASSPKVVTEFVNGAFVDDLVVMVSKTRGISSEAHDKCIHALQIAAEKCSIVRTNLLNMSENTLRLLLNEYDDCQTQIQLCISRICFAIAFAEAEVVNSVSQDIWRFPVGVFDMFHVYGIIDRTPTISELSTSTVPVITEAWKFFLDYPSFKLKQSETECDIEAFIAANFKLLEHATCHNHFREALSQLEVISSLNVTRPYLTRRSLPQTVSRILTTSPLSTEDHELLQHLLHFLRTADIDLNGVKDVLFTCIKCVLLPQLQKQSILIENFHPSQSQHNISHLSQDQHYIQGDIVNFELLGEIVSFIQWVVSRMDQTDLTYLVSSTPCISILKDYTHNIFASESGMAKNHRKRIKCLQALLPFANLRTLVSSVSIDVIQDLVRLFVQVLGYSQHNYINATNGNNFTYKDRNIYRWVAMSIRNISRTVVADDYNILWGDHWLFDGELDWLLNLLNEDERIMQKFGLGILGNLILMSGSYVHLSSKIPQFLDMAFSFVLDPEQHASKTKEALLIINNFTVSLYQGIQNAASNSSYKDASPHHSQTVYGKEIINIFESNGFFEKFEGILQFSDNDVSYFSALCELLLNLSILVPEYLCEKLHNISLWAIILDKASIKRSLSSASFGKHQATVTMHTFIKNQCERANKTLALRTVCNILQLTRILAFHNDSFRKFLVSKTNLLTFLGSTINDTWLFYQPDATFSEKVDEEWCDMLAAVYSTFSDVLLDASSLDTAALMAMFHTAVGGQIMWLLAMTLKTDRHFIVRRASCILLARLFPLHFSEVVNLNLESLFEQLVSEYTQVMIGGLICQSLMRILPDVSEIDDPVLMESVRLALQCLLGRCEFAKQLAMTNGFPKQLVTRAQRILATGSKLDDAKQNQLYWITNLFRHFCAGSTAAKLVGIEERIYVVIETILRLKNVKEATLLETLGCLRNFVANCVEAKRVVLDKQKNPHTLDRLMTILKGKSTTTQAFLATIEVLKMLVVQRESRLVLFKMNIGNELIVLLASFEKAKDSSRSEGIIQFFIHASFTTDGQAIVMRLTGMMEILTTSMKSKSLSLRRVALSLLTNLAHQRENRAYILADENLLTILRDIMESKWLYLLAPTTTLIWTLLYDSEKAKVVLKGSGIKECVNALEADLKLQYVKQLSDKDLNGGGKLDHKQKSKSGQLNPDDWECLSQTLRNCSKIYKLLS